MTLPPPQSLGNRTRVGGITVALLQLGRKLLLQPLVQRRRRPRRLCPHDGHRRHCDRPRGAPRDPVFLFTSSYRLSWPGGGILRKWKIPITGFYYGLLRILRKSLLRNITIRNISPLSWHAMPYCHMCKGNAHDSQQRGSPAAQFYFGIAFILIKVFCVLLHILVGYWIPFHWSQDLF
jgi:hypothetical protein